MKLFTYKALLQSGFSHAADKDYLLLPMNKENFAGIDYKGCSCVLNPLNASLGLDKLPMVIN